MPTSAPAMTQIPICSTILPVKAGFRKPLRIFLPRTFLFAQAYQPSAVPSGQGEKVRDPQKEAAKGECRPEPPKQRGQQQIYPRAGGQGPGLPGLTLKPRPDHRPAGPKLQLVNRNLQSPEGRQVAQLVKPRRQRKGRQHSPTVQGRQEPRCQIKTGPHPYPQNTSPGQPTRLRSIIERPAVGRAAVCNRVCKPGSVLDSHLSCRTVAGTLHATSPETAGPAICLLHGVAPDRVYSTGQSPAGE